MSRHLSCKQIELHNLKERSKDTFDEVAVLLEEVDVIKTHMGLTQEKVQSPKLSISRNDDDNKTDISDDPTLASYRARIGSVVDA